MRIDRLWEDAKYLHLQAIYHLSHRTARVPLAKLEVAPSFYAVEVAVAVVPAVGETVACMDVWQAHWACALSCCVWPS